MESEIYLDLNTWIHRLDPRTKIIMLAVFFVLILYFPNPLWAFPFAVLVFLEGFLSRSLVNLNRIKGILIILTIFSVVMWTFFSSGTTTLFWIIKLQALEFAVSRMLVIVSLITAGMVFISTTRNEEFILGMIRMGLPYRVGFAISTALRLVPTIVASVGTIAQAQRSRGLDLDSGNMLDRIRKFVPLLIPVFISTIRNTNLFSMALESKGFGARPQRTYYLNPQFTTADYATLAFLGVLFVGVTVMKILGYGTIPGLIRF
jgi:energy-coupling factor transport system permease protein